MSLLTAARVRELFNYDPETGRLIRRMRTSNNTKAGDIAGHTHGSGYVYLGADKREYKAHRLVWLYVHGEWPKGVIDHINGDKADNRLANLRDVSHAMNLQNIKKARADSASGIAGIRKNSKSDKWQARITLAGVQKYLGSFPTQAEASAAYIAAKREFHPASTV
jgi:hypothetical protein